MLIANMNTSDLIHIPLTPFDHVAPRIFTKWVLYLPLKPDISPDVVFIHLRGGLQRLYTRLPWLNGKVHWQSPDTPGWRSRQLEIRYALPDQDCPKQEQFRFNMLDLNRTYTDLKEMGFPASAINDDDLLNLPFWPDFSEGAPVFTAQANFIPGGCLLTLGFAHSACDGWGIFSLGKLWADYCASQDAGLKDAMLPSFPRDSDDRTLLEKIWQREGTLIPAGDTSSLAWGLVALDAPGVAPSKYPAGMKVIPEPFASMATTASIFYISASSMETLRRQYSRDGGTKQLSNNDLMCALMWQSLLRARFAAHRARLASKGESFNAEEVETEDASLELFIDGRQNYSDSLPPTYLGNMGLFNRVTLQLGTLLSSTTTVGKVAEAIRARAQGIDKATLQEAYGIIRGVADLGEPKVRFSKVIGWDMMISPLNAFSTTAFNFGHNGFENGGRIDDVRGLMTQRSRYWRSCYLMPQKRNGGVEVSFSLFEDEMEALTGDAQFARYAALL